MADFNGFKKNGETYIPNDATARASISTIEGKIPSAASSSNKLVDTTTMNTALAGKVDKVTGKGLSTNDYDNTAKGIVDNIQSNVIANTQLIADTVGWSGKNLFGYTKSSTGIFTVNSDKTVTVNGEAPAGGNQNFDMLSDNEIPAGTYILNGCPDGGGVGTYGFSLREDSASGTIIGNDTGSGLQFTLSTAKKVNIRLYVVGGQTIANKIFKPMIRKADILDATYEPYRGTTAFPRDEQAVLGAKNLLPNKMGSEGIATVNSDYTITLNGTTSAVLNSIIASLTEEDLPKGRYILSIGDISLDAGAQGVVAANAYNGSTSKGQLAGVHSNEIAFDVDYNGYNRVEFVIYLQSGNSYSNVVVEPMLRLASDTDSTYVPYAMTNRELTDAVVLKDITSDITLNTEQTAYNVSSLHIQRIGQLVVVTGDISSLTEDAVPQGRNFVTLASLLPKPIFDTHILIPPRGTGNQAEIYIVGNNSGLQMRGGTISQAYQFVLVYITAS